MNPSSIVVRLLEKGVSMPLPETVFIGEEVRPERIAAENVVLHPHCRITGADTLISAGCRLGEEGPAVMDGCRLGPGVRLKSGFFQRSVFLRGASAGLGAHVREGTILEEGASVAHTVGLKQTILFPFVTLGSLINFCDCLMTGGTGPKHHGEVGSSYIHFNFTPNQDKATASLLGEVPSGVMLNQAPIFLGGQGGLVGPCRLAFGTVIAAGTVWRKDQNEPNRLLTGSATRGGARPFTTGVYSQIGRIVTNNLLYLANLTALSAWIRHVRRAAVSPDLPDALVDGLSETLALGIAERLKRLADLRDRMPAAIEAARASLGDAAADLVERKRLFHDRWPELRDALAEAMSAVPGKGDGDTSSRDEFLAALHRRKAEAGPDYVRLIQSLSPEEAALGTRWLQGIVDGVMDAACGLLPEVVRRGNLAR